MPKVNETTLIVDLTALEHNYNFFKSKIKPTTKFLGVVKAFGYGSEAIAIAKKLEHLGIDYLAVAYVKEGIVLREAGIKTPILVLHPQKINLPELIAHQLEPSIYSPYILKAFIETIANYDLEGYPIHIKFNTGLNRLGFWENDIDYINEKIGGHKQIAIKGLLSHLAASEDKNEEAFSLQQIKKFEEITKAFELKLGVKPIKHQLNTSGILNYPQAQFDMVRSGIGLYGFGNHHEIDKQLRPIASLKTLISQIHLIEPEESVGYNRAYTAKGYQKIATLPLGHADGIGRLYGNEKGYVMIGNEKAPIIGNVCMDMLMIDITGIDCKEGDEVVIFGEGSSAETLAGAAGTISYELLTAVSQRVKREIIE